METSSFDGPHFCVTVLRRGLVCLGLALLVASVSPVVAQQYQADEVDEQARKLSAFTTNWVRDPARYAAEKDRFEEYFNKAYFPSMTRFGPDDLAGLGDLRTKLFSDVLMKSANEALQRHLTELAKTYMIKVVQGAGYHPAVRYNATLVLGMLDAVYGDDRAKRLPQPLPEANAYLTRVVDLAAQGRNVPPYVVVGALVGLERHARFRESLDPAAVDAMTAAVLKLLAKDPPLAELDRDVSEWIKLRGASVLARLGSPGADGHVHQTLLNLLAGTEDRPMTLDARCQLAALFALVNYEGASVDAQATAQQFLQLAVDVGQAEAKRAKDFQDLQIGGGFAGGGGRYGGRELYGSYGQSQEYDRRTLLARLTDLRTGLEAVRPLVPADKQAAIDAILATTKQTLDAAEDKDTVDLDVVSQVRAMAAAIDEAVTPGAAPPAEESADEF